MPNISELYLRPARQIIADNFSRYGLHPLCRSCPLERNCKDKIYNAPGLVRFECYIKEKE